MQGPADLINILPVIFGFVPQESLCVLVSSGSPGRVEFSMRLDLDDDYGPAATADLACSHVAAGPVNEAIIVAISDSPDKAREYAIACEQAAVTLVDTMTMWATDTTYWMSDSPEIARTYRRSLDHLAVVEAIAGGVQIAPSRDDVKQRIAPVDGSQRRQADLTSINIHADIDGLLAERPSSPIESIAAEDLADIMSAAEHDCVVSDSDVLRLAAWLTYLPDRDLFLRPINRRNAVQWLELWHRVARIASGSARPHALGVAAYCAHRAGDGAQALIAAEAAIEEDPDNGLAHSILTLIECGIGPREVEQKLLQEFGG